MRVARFFDGWLGEATKDALDGLLVDFVPLDRYPDVIISAGWPKIFSAEKLASFTAPAINIHPSPLPLYRGPKPLEQQLEAGVRSTAITIHHMTKEVDAGPIIVQRHLTWPPGAGVQEIGYKIRKLLPSTLRCAFASLYDARPVA